MYKYEFARKIKHAFYYMCPMPPGYENDAYLVYWYTGRATKPRCRWITGLRAARRLRNAKRRSGHPSYLTTLVIDSPCYE